MPLVGIYLFIFLGFLLIATYFLMGQKEKVPRNPQFEKELKERKRREILAPSRGPLTLLKPLNKPFLILMGGEQKLKGRLLVGGMKIGVEGFLFIKELLTIGLPLALYFFLGPKQVDFIWLLGAALMGFFLPDLHLKTRVNKRKAEVLRELPSGIDLLALCVSGGLDFMTGLKWVIQRSRPSAFVEEFSTVFHELEMGRSRQEAFRSLAKRLDMPEVYSFVRTIIQADKMGISVGEVLSILSDEVRRQRFQRGERMALKAPIKMLLPLIVFILPVIGVIVGGPVFLQFMQQGVTLKGPATGR